MRISVNITNFSVPEGPGALRKHLSEIAQVADETGIDTLWVADHLLQADPASSIDEPILEAYTTLGFLAARTERVRLGTMVAAASYRAPSITIKAITTLDVLSGGRAWFGIGAGYQADEAEAMGLTLPPVAERFERLEETLRLAKQMWAGDDSPFAGNHYQLGRPINSPNAIQRPHPPILVGGTGEKKTLRLVAQYADACNLFDIPDGGKTVRHKLAVLGEHCEEVCRPYNAIEKTISTALRPGESASEFRQRCEQLSELGIEHVTVITRGTPWTAEAVQIVAASG